MKLMVEFNAQKKHIEVSDLINLEIPMMKQRGFSKDNVVVFLFNSFIH
jgi:hypothetical protein